MLLNEMEAIKIAVSIEEGGLAFYRAAAQSARDPETAKVFDSLARAEAAHKEIFLEMQDEIASAGRSLGFTDAPEVDAYIRQLVKTNVFGSPEEAAQKGRNTSLAEALDLGIQAERDSILFYSALVDATADKTTHKALERLIAEERRHLVILSEMADESASEQG